MISDRYYFDPSAVCSRHPSKSNFQKVLQGKVEFDLGELKDPKLGLVLIKGQYPRINARFRRITVTPEEFEPMRIELLNWATLFFDTTTQSKYFERLVDTTCLFTFCVNPFHPVGSAQLELVAKCHFLLWICDDIMEAAIQKNVCHTILKNGLAQLIRLLKNRNEVFEDVEHFPGFRPLFEGLSDFLRCCNEIIPEFEAKGRPLRSYIKLLLEMVQWFGVNGFESAYSEETFRLWRKRGVFLDGTIEINWIAGGGTLPKSIQKSPPFARYLDIIGGIIAAKNDIVGLKKEFIMGEFDNMIVFRVFKKGVSVAKAVEEELEILTNYFYEYLILRDNMLEQFEYHADLVKYVDYAEAVIDGNNLFYANSSAKYDTAGHVVLTD